MKAVEAARRATERTPSSEAQLMLGRALFRIGDLRQSLRALTVATQRPPVADGAFTALADVAERAGRLGIARDALLSDIALRGDVGEGVIGAARASRIATLCLKTGDPQGAVTWFERALARRPDDETIKRQLDTARRQAS
jgi:predicted Zn-dependent protease